MKAQRAGAEALVLNLPVLAQAADRRGREPRGVLAEQLLKRRAEVPGREAAQVEHRQHVVDLRRSTRVGRQDPRAEPRALPGLLIHALVVDARRLNRDRARPDRHCALPGPAVADNEPLAVLAAHLGEPLDVLADLRLQRRRDDPPRTFSRELVERDRDLVLLPDREAANIHHGVPSFSAFRRSVLINREGTPPSSSGTSTTFGYSSALNGLGRSSRTTERPQQRGRTTALDEDRQPAPSAGPPLLGSEQRSKPIRDSYRSCLKAAARTRAV
jgi:hypothetical protein